MGPIETLRTATGRSHRTARLRARRPSPSSSWATSDGSGLGALVLLVIAIGLIVAFWQYVVLIAVGGLGIGLVWWARNRGRSAMPKTTDPPAMLAELGDLHAAGVLTDAEFETKQAAVLGAAQAGPNLAISTAADESD
jgi:Short C-terminal domain